MVFSRWKTCLLAMGMEMSRRSAARVKLPLCTTWQKTFMLSRVSMLGFLVCMGFQAAFVANLRNLLVAINGGKLLRGLRNGLRKISLQCFKRCVFFQAATRFYCIDCRNSQREIALADDV